MIEDVVVVGEVVARDDIYARLLLDLPVSETQTLALCEKLMLRELATPISFGGLLEVPVCSHTRETEHRSGGVSVGRCPAPVGTYD